MTPPAGSPSRALPAAAERYSLGVYHFNIQYAAGLPSSYFKQTTASLQPFLRFYETFPQWKANLEISGHHVAFLERHFPEDLARLRTLNQRGQVEIVTVHYSDQIYLAYPKHDLVKSIEVADEILARNGLTRSPVWFGQENFFGEGVAEVMKECGFSVALVNGNYLRHLHGTPGKPPAPYYTYHGVDCLASGLQRQHDDVLQTWNFWGDGELAFARFNVYFPGYGASEKKFVKRANHFYQQHRAGVQFVTVTEYLAEIKRRGYEPEPLGPFLDGSWNHYDYGGVFLWMGLYRMAFERDGRVRARTIQSRNRVRLAEVLLDHPDSTVSGHLADADRAWCARHLKRAWKHQLLAEVSDSTGQTPFPIEVKYSFAESAAAIADADRVVDKICAAAGVNHGQWLDLETGQLAAEPRRPLTRQLQVLAERPAQYEIDLETFRAGTGLPVSLHGVARASVRSQYYRLADDHFVWRLRFRPKRVGFHQRVLAILHTKNNKRRSDFFWDRLCRWAGFTVPLRVDHVGYCPAGLEGDFREYPLAEFAWRQMFLPCPNGLLQVAPDAFLVKHVAHGNSHLAFRVDQQARTAGLMTLNPPRIGFDWLVSVVKGTPEEAVRLANALNVTPELEL